MRRASYEDNVNGDVVLDNRTAFYGDTPQGAATADPLCHHLGDQCMPCVGHVGTVDEQPLLLLHTWIGAAIEVIHAAALTDLSDVRAKIRIQAVQIFWRMGGLQR